MAQASFTKWCMDPNGRTAVSINPKMVDCVEEYGPAFVDALGEEWPAASRVTMNKGKQEFIVQGTVEEVSNKLNETEFEV